MRLMTPRTTFAVLALVGVALQAAAQPAEPRYPRLYSINLTPYIDSTGELLHQFGGWNDPRALNRDYVNDFQNASHGLVNWRQTVEMNLDYYPIFNDGFRYDDASYTAAVNQWQSGGGQGGFYLDSMVDYKMIAINFDLARRVDFGEINEVNNNCAPFFQYWETTMLGYGGYWCNSGPQQRVPSSRIFIILGLNYERGVAEMIHSYTHRTESILRHVFGVNNWNWNLSYPQNLWDRFSLAYGTSAAAGNTVFGVGHCHFPPNGVQDYDYGNPSFADSTAPMWLTMEPGDPHDYPDITGTPVAVNRETWGGPDYHRNYLNWFYYHLPRFDDTNNKDGLTRLNNWWEYLNHFNDHAESGGDFYQHDNAAQADPHDLSPTRVTSNDRDDWRPQVNSSGRIVFAGQSRRAAITTVLPDGSEVVDVDVHRVAEMPKINENDQIVFQAFDGRDFEIYTATADGSVVHQITDNDVQDWHADINAAGRIVWEQFDGEDFEIVSCDFDGGNFTQITDNSHGGSGYPREDMWPVINDSNRVAWMGHDGNTWDIFSANADGSDLVQLVNNSVNDEFPQINNNGLVVWHGWHNNSDAEIWTADAYSADSASQYSSGVNRLNWWPQVNDSGDIVWMQRRWGDGYYWQILLNNEPLTDNQAHDQHPVIDNDGRIAWQGFDGNDYEIYAWLDGAVVQITDNDYDDQAPHLVTGSPLVWHAESEIGDPAGSRYVGPTTEIYAVDAAVTPPLLGDLNCDGTLDFFDIDAFVTALLYQSQFDNLYPGCDRMNGDLNNDGAVNFFDIDPFVAALVGS